MKKSLLTVILLFFVFGTTKIFSQILVTVPDTIGVIGNTINIPVKLYGANSSSNQPVLGIDLNISYLPSSLVYSGVTNFYSETPQNQWTIFNLSGLFKAIWIEPSYVNSLEIPDGTVLFEIVFTYMGGTSPLQFTKHEFINEYNEVISSEAINGAIGSGSKTLNLTAFLEGLYTTGGAMHEAMNDMGEPQWGAGVADQITVELHNETDYTTIEHTATNVDLNTDGTATVSIPATYAGMYWITIKHRNSIETVSAAVVDFGGATIDYNFTTAASQSYGDNMKDVGEGVYAIYAGDMAMSGTSYPDPTVPDGVIDVDDVYYIYNAYVIDNLVGFYPSDINGDSSVDINDVYLAYDNYLLNIYVQTP